MTRRRSGLLLAAALLLTATTAAWATVQTGDIALTATWVQIAGAGDSLSVQVKNNQPVLIQQSASAPIATINAGDVLTTGATEREVLYNLPTNLWAKALGTGSGTVSVQPAGAASSAGGASTANQGAPGTQPWPTSDAGNAPFQGAVPMTVGTTYAAARSIRLNCTAAGTVSMTLADGSTEVYPAQGSTGGTYQTLPFAVTAVNISGTTATCTYANLR